MMGVPSETSLWRKRLANIWSVTASATDAPEDWAGAIRGEGASVGAGTVGAGLPVPDVLRHRDDLARMRPAFERALAADLGLVGMAARLCPVLLEDGSTAVLALAEHAQSDAAHELVRMLLRAGHRLAARPLYVVPPHLLLAVARGQIDAAVLRNRRQVLADPVRTSLALTFYEMVAWAVEQSASDLHLNARLGHQESEVRVSVGGQYLVPERYRHMPTATLMDILAVAWMDVRGGNGAVFDPTREQQGRIWVEIAGRPVMLRWASLAADAGPSVCLRLLRLDAQLRTEGLADLGYLPDQAAAMTRACLSEGGAVVLAGVVGSGKSTTLAAMLRSIPARRKIVTLEDPVEYLISDALQNTISRHPGEADAGTFDDKLRTLKRSAMHDLMIGEIRDAETGRAFMDLAGSGINLYTTTHAGSALLIGERLASDFIGVSRDFLATPGILKLLVYQALLPRLCEYCAIPLDAWLHDEPQQRGWAQSINQLYGLDLARLRVRNPAGCPHCAVAHLPEMNGMAGRTVVAEMIEPGCDEVYLDCLKRRDNLALRRHFAARRSDAYDAAGMIGKTAMDCAVYKMSCGEIDPRDVERRFRAFATVALERQGLHG